MGVTVTPRKPTPPKRLLSGKRIFVVEDDVTNLAIISTLLKQEEALVGFARWSSNTIGSMTLMAPIDAILLDLNLDHGSSGFDIFDKIRANKQFDKVPIVAVSALDPALAMSEARKKGFSGFISKPVDFSCFAEQIAAVANGEQVWFAV
ncbi:MAG: response regulator [Anaerolineae bacterium]|nr:response regulator [Anaerolineae bacterium]